jgi:hypothetical protein
VCIILSPADQGFVDLSFLLPLRDMTIIDYIDVQTIKLDSSDITYLVFLDQSRT